MMDDHEALNEFDTMYNRVSAYIAGISVASNHSEALSQILWHDLPKLFAEVKRLQGEDLILRKALASTKTFIEYARYELEEKLVSGSQFPSQECADKEISKITAVLDKGECDE